MAADGRQISVITVGGKGFSLSSSSVFAVANRLALVRVDSSVLDKLSTRQPPSAKFQFSIPESLSQEEARASHLILLNKLLLSGTSGVGVRSTLPLLIVDALNQGFGPSFEEAIDVTEDELIVLQKSSAALDGLCAILDHQSSALSAIADAVAALSCEALKADVFAFNLIDSGDGFSAKDEVGVASDLKVLLNGSKLVGKLESEAVSEIPKVHGCLREISKLVHSRTRVELNSAAVKGGKGGSKSVGTGKAVATVFSPLAAALRYVGEISLCRGKLNVDSISNDDLRSRLMEMFDKGCSSLDDLKNLFVSISQAVFEEDYVKFLHEINSLSGMVWKLISWEATLAFLSLEGSELIENFQGSVPSKLEVNGENAKSGKKSEKRKKVLGKGTCILMQIIKERLQTGVGEVAGYPSIMEKWVEYLHSCFDLKELGFDSLLGKVKEIVESNESRRLPKLPKVIKSSLTV